MEEDDIVFHELPATKRKLSAVMQEPPPFHFNSSDSTKMAVARKKALEIAAVEREFGLAAELSAHTRDQMADDIYTPGFRVYADHIAATSLNGADMNVAVIAIPLVGATAQSHVVHMDVDGTRRRDQTSRGIETNVLMFGASGAGKSPAYKCLVQLPMDVAGGLIQRNMHGRKISVGDKTTLHTLGTLRDTCQTNTARVVHMAKIEKSAAVAGRGSQIYISEHEGSTTLKSLLAEPALVNKYLDGEQLGTMVAGQAGQERIVNKPYVNMCILSQNQSVYYLIDNYDATISGLSNRLMICVMRSPSGVKRLVPLDMVPTQRSGERRDDGGVFDAVKNLEEVLCLLSQPNKLFALVLLIVNDLCHDNEGRPVEFVTVVTDSVYQRYEQIEELAADIREKLRGAGMHGQTSFAKLPTNVLSWAATIHMMEEALRFAGVLLGDADLIDARSNGAAFAARRAGRSETDKRSKMSQTLDGILEVYGTVGKRLDIDGWKRMLVERAAAAGVSLVPASRRSESSQHQILSDALDFDAERFRVMDSPAAIESALSLWVDSGSTMCVLTGLLKEAHDTLAHVFPPVMKARQLMFEQYASPEVAPVSDDPSTSVEWRRSCGSYVLIMMAGFAPSPGLAEVFGFYDNKYAALDSKGFEKKRSTLIDKLKKKLYDTSDPGRVFPVAAFASSFINALAWNYGGRTMNRDWISLAFKQLADDGIGHVENSTANKGVEWLPAFASRFPTGQAAASESMLTTACNSVAVLQSSGSGVAHGALTATGPIFEKFLPDDDEGYTTLRDTLARFYGLSNIGETFYPREHSYGERLRRDRRVAEAEMDGSAAMMRTTM